MIEVSNIDVYGFEAAIRGMRNPMNSWCKSDSGWDAGEFYVGKNDRNLMRNLYMAGTEHRKYLRMIHVSMDITAPLYWWKEFDTYKIGTVANSCSTMHKIHAKEFEMDDFSHEHLNQWSKVHLCYTINLLNRYRYEYNDTKDRDMWWQMIQLLPSSYNQKRTVDLSYETVMTILKHRTGHKLDEWNEFCDTLRGLDLMEEIMEG